MKRTHTHFLRLWFLIAPLAGAGNAVAFVTGSNDIELSYPANDTTPGDNTWSIGTKELIGDDNYHWGYDIETTGTESLERIEGRIEAQIGSANSAQHYNSWEVVRIDGLPTSPTSYDWVLDLDVEITTLDGSLSDSAYGIIMHHYAAGNSSYHLIKEVAGSVHIHDFETVTYPGGKEKSQPSAYGVEVGAYYDIQTLSTSVLIENATAAAGYQFNAGTRIGVDAQDKAITGAGIVGDITIKNTYESTGILFVGTGDNNSSAQEPLVGYISSTINITSDASSPVGAAVGIFVNGSEPNGQSNEVKGVLSGVFDGNITIDVVYDKEVAQTRAPIVSGIRVLQSDELDQPDAHITFGDGAHVSAQYTLEGESNKQLGEAVQLIASRDENQFRLTTEHDSDVVTLVGNLGSYHVEHAADGSTSNVVHDLSIEKGTFVVTADKIEASSLTLGHIDASTRHMTDGNLILTQSTDASQVEHLDFYVNSPNEGDYSHIEIAEGAALTLNPPDDFNIYLGDDVLMNQEFTITLIDGLVEGLGEGSVINIKNSLGDILWSIEMEDGYAYYFSDKVTAGEFEVIYTEEGVVLNAYVANILIPEPSTATLSLMALAALLARRRRKAH